MNKENGSVQALLYTKNGDNASIEARKILSEFNVLFNEIDSANVSASANVQLPTLISREGDFAGLERIREFIDIITHRP